MLASIEVLQTGDTTISEQNASEKQFFETYQEPSGHDPVTWMRQLDTLLQAMSPIPDKVSDRIKGEITDAEIVKAMKGLKRQKIARSGWIRFNVLQSVHEPASANFELRVCRHPSPWTTAIDNETSLDDPYSKNKSV